MKNGKNGIKNNFDIGNIDFESELETIRNEKEIFEDEEINYDEEDSIISMSEKSNVVKIILWY